MNGEKVRIWKTVVMGYVMAQFRDPPRETKPQNICHYITFNFTFCYVQITVLSTQQG